MNSNLCFALHAKNVGQINEAIKSKGKSTVKQEVTG